MGRLGALLAHRRLGGPPWGPKPLFGRSPSCEGARGSRPDGLPNPKARKS